MKVFVDHESSLHPIDVSRAWPGGRHVGAGRGNETFFPSVVRVTRYEFEGPNVFKRGKNCNNPFVALGRSGDFIV